VPSHSALTAEVDCPEIRWFWFGDSLENRRPTQPRQATKLPPLPSKSWPVEKKPGRLMFTSKNHLVACCVSSMLLILCSCGGGPSGTTTPPESFQLSITAAGTGAGTISSSPTGISCGATCSASFASGTQVTLTETAGANSTFTGWAGACSGSNPSCTLTLSASQQVTATFSANPGTSVARVRRKQSCRNQLRTDLQRQLCQRDSGNAH
jgi:hypothetical protein